MKMKTTKAGRIQGKMWGLLVIVFAIALCGVADAYAGEGKTITVSVGEAVTLSAENVSKLAIADPTVADVAPLSDKELSIIGKKPGVTSLTIVRNDGSPAEIHRVEVGNDAAAATIREMIGQPSVAVRSIGDTLVLDGQVDDELQAARAAQVATAYRDKVLNLLEVKNPRQIRIRMRVAEVRIEDAKRIGIRYFGANGEVRYGYGRVLTEEPGAAASSAHAFLNSSVTSIQAGTIPIGVEAALRLLVTKGHARFLSEPTLVTLSGKEASFLVGEERPIIQQLQNTFTVEFKEVGVRMKVKPVADSQNRINTTINAEVSQVTDTVGAQAIPIIATKKAETSLQVNDGQTIVIGGLLDNNISSDLLRKLPWLGDIPIIGLLFRDKDFQRQQKEIMFLVTMEIVKDIDGDVANAERSPAMKKWNREESNKNVMEVPKKGYDWGMHNPNGLGFTGLGSEKKEEKSKAAAQEAAPAAAPVESPAPAPAAVAEPMEEAAPAPAAQEAAPAAAPAEEMPAPAAPKPVEKTAAPPQPKAEEPAPAAPAKEPSVNFRPARPAGQ